MAEKIVIATLELDTEKLQKESEDFLKTREKLKAQNREIKKSTDNLSKATKEQAKTYIENEARIKKLSTAYNRNKKILAENLTGIKGLNDELEREITRRGDALESNKRLKIIRDQINVSTKAGRDAVEEINKKIDKNTEFVKDNSSENEKLKFNIGNYTEAVKDALAQTTIYSKVLSNLKPIMNLINPLFKLFRANLRSIITNYKLAAKAANQYSGALKYVSIFTNLTSTALKLFRLALISTGIGAIVVLLGSLITFLAKTQKGTEIVTKVVAAFGAAISVVIDTLSKIGSAIWGLITGQKSLSEAWNEGTEALSGMGDEMAREIKLAYQLAAAKIALEKAEQLLAFRRAAANTQIKKLNKVVEDTMKLDEERIKAAKEIERLETDIADKELANAQQAIALKLDKLSLDEEAIMLMQRLQEGTITYDELLKSIGVSESTKDDVEELLELFTKLQEKQQRSFEVRTTNQNKLNTLQQQIFNKEKARREKAIDDLIKRSKEELDLFIALEGDKAKNLKESLQFEEQLRDKRLANLKKELQFKKISQTKYETEVLNIKREFLARQAELAVENFEREVRFNNELLEFAIRSGNLTADEITKIKLENLEDNNTIELQKLQELHDKKLINESEFHARKLELENDYEDEKQRLEDEREARRREEKKLREQLQYEEDLLLLEERNASDFERELARIEYEEEQKLAFYEDARRRGLISEENYQKAITNINRQAESDRTKIHAIAEYTRLQGTAKVAQGVAQIIGEQSAVGKAAALAAATINTYAAANLALKTIPPPFGKIQAGISIATGLANVAKIAGVKGLDGATSGLASLSSGFGSIQAGQISKTPKAERGALIELGGNRHSSGGNTIFDQNGNPLVEAEKGEVLGVMNRNASRLFLEFNNQFSGISSGANFLRSGSMLGQGKYKGVDYDLMKGVFIDAIKELPPNVLNLERFNDFQNEGKQVEMMANG